MLAHAPAHRFPNLFFRCAHNAGISVGNEFPSGWVPTARAASAPAGRSLTIEDTVAGTCTGGKTHADGGAKGPFIAMLWVFGFMRQAGKGCGRGRAGFLPPHVKQIFQTSRRDRTHGAHPLAAPAAVAHPAPATTITHDPHCHRNARVRSPARSTPPLGCPSSRSSRARARPATGRASLPVSRCSHPWRRRC